jgi:hypothetical protein
MRIGDWRSAGHTGTKLPGHKYITDLKHMGAHVHPLKTNLNTITTFANIYDESARRTQHVLEVQEPITCDDFSFFPHDLLKDATVLVAPVIDEVDMDLYPALARSAMLAIALQGYFRALSRDGKVAQKRWVGFQGILRHAQATIFSEEDIDSGSHTVDNELLKAIVDECCLVALTRVTFLAFIPCYSATFADAVEVRHRPFFARTIW